MPDKVEVAELQDIQSAVTKLREDVEGKITLTEDEKTKINSFIDDYEVKGQEMLAKEKEKEEKERTQAEKIELLEKKLVDMSVFNKPAVDDTKAYKNSAEYKAISFLCSHGEQAAFANMEFKDYLRTDVGEQGGFLVPEMMTNVLLKEIQEISPVRQFARKWGPFGAKTIIVPVRVGIPSAPYQKELEEGTNTDSTYRAENITAYRQQADVGATQDILSFANFDMESQIMSDANESFAKTEGEKFILGTGVKEPEGILANDNIETIDTVTGTTLTLDDVILLSAQLKIGYNPIYFFNREVLVNLRVEKDSNGNYLWRVGGQSQPTQINGYNYAIFQDMPGKTSGAWVAGDSVVGFGDLFQGYSIYDSIAMSVIRDNVTQKKKGLIEFAVNRWNTGQVVLPEAIKLLVIKA